jgi:hypothetical protein
MNSESFLFVKDFSTLEASIAQRSISFQHLNLAHQSSQTIKTTNRREPNLLTFQSSRTHQTLIGT